MKPGVQFRTDREHWLIWSREDYPQRPTVTVEDYGKWYGVYVVRPDGSFAEYAFPDWIDDAHSMVSAYVDHVPNPQAVWSWAASQKWAVDDRALEVLVGRWEIEARGNWFMDRSEE